ncbi:integrase core domain-containing protein [Chryseobacterium sp. OSA05B]|uniref:integrase core domain-containing protein n=1 Tax=Chryseobacterium sp. OSA05B TaxID=2862650 RepID=UPI001CBBA3F9
MKFLFNSKCQIGLKELFTYRPKPKSIDNGPEFLSKAFVDFFKDNEVELQYIQPGKPAQNAYIERLNRTLREDVFGYIYICSAL